MSSTSAVADLNCVRKCASKGSPSNICLLQRWWPRKWRARSAQHMRLEFHHETKILERVKKNSGIPINLLASWFGGRSKINLSYNEPPSFKWKFGKWLVLFKDISFQVSSVKVSNEKKHLHYPKHSIYGNCPYILLMFIVNVDQYTVDWVFGYYLHINWHQIDTSLLIVESPQNYF